MVCDQEPETCSLVPSGRRVYIPLTTYLRTFKIGDFVDVKVNGAVHKGMAHKFYYGRTGGVWNVPNVPSASKSISRKRIHVQISRCGEELRLRKLKNDQLKAEAKARGEVITMKRQPEGPKPGSMVEGASLETMTPIPYDIVNDLKGGY